MHIVCTDLYRVIAKKGGTRIDYGVPVSKIGAKSYTFHCILSLKYFVSEFFECDVSAFDERK